MQLILQNLTIGYGTQAIVTNINATAHAGEMICMLGQNGCGKSTLLRTLCGLQPTIDGMVYFQEDESGQEESHILAELTHTQKARLLALVLTERLSVENTCVCDVVAMGRYPYASFLGGLTEEDETIIKIALTQVNLLHKKDEYYNCLSDGEKQRVLIAKALAQQTPFIFLDEPTAHLDLPNRIRILLLLRKLAHTQQKCVIISTHELDLALQMADTIWLMAKKETRTELTVASPQHLIASGAFAEAFTDDNFTFENNMGQLLVKLKK